MLGTGTVTSHGDCGRARARFRLKRVTAGISPSAGARPKKMNKSLGPSSFKVVKFLRVTTLSPAAAWRPSMPL